jgi:hypothetical protein
MVDERLVYLSENIACSLAPARITGPRRQADAIHCERIGSIAVGEPAHFRSLAIFPLFRTGSGQAEPNQLPLDLAIALAGVMHR